MTTCLVCAEPVLAADSYFGMDYHPSCIVAAEERRKLEPTGGYCLSCGQPVGITRDYAANYPFDSECACGPRRRPEVEPIEESWRKVGEHIEALREQPVSAFIHPNPELAAPSSEEPKQQPPPAEEQQQERPLGQQVPDLQG